MGEFFDSCKRLILEQIASYLEAQEKLLGRVNPWGPDVSRRLADFSSRGKMIRGSLVALGYLLFRDESRGRLRYLYAAKANMASEVAHAAYRSGWGAETSSRQDLMHLEWLGTRGLLLPDLRVVCNGFKLPASRFTVPVERPGPPARSIT